MVPEGFACLSLAYWATPETQPWFTEIPLERIERGLRWLAAQPGTKTDEGRVALVGVSKGAELALLVAATFPELVGPVVAYTPSSVVWQGIDLTLPPGEEAARIKVEKCTGPVLLVSGGDDRVWPTARMCEMLTERMVSYGKSDRIAHLHYPKAGHMLFPYSRPADTLVPEMLTDFGGSPEENAAAHADAWPKVLGCLRGDR